MRVPFCVVFHDEVIFETIYWLIINELNGQNVVILLRMWVCCVEKTRSERGKLFHFLVDSK